MGGREGRQALLQTIVYTYERLEHKYLFVIATPSPYTEHVFLARVRISCFIVSVYRNTLCIIDLIINIFFSADAFCSIAYFAEMIRRFSIMTGSCKKK